MLCSASFAQDTVSIPSSSKIGVLTGDPVTIYSNVVNEGSIYTNANAVVNFYGKLWINGTNATLIDESADGVSGRGGIFRFLGNNPVYNNIGIQSVFGGYNAAGKTGATFPNLEVDNTLGVLLSDLSDLKIRSNLNFVNGHIFLNGWNLVVGNKKPGTITGYSDKSFIITGPDIAGGFLYREQLNQTAGEVVFPVGTSIANYEPASIRFNGTTDDFRVRVFDSVYQYATNGMVNNRDFTNKTWNIGHGNQLSSTDLTLQHMNADEGADFRTFRNLSYVSRFENNKWDYVETPDNLPVAGNLTTGGALNNSTMQTRRFRDGFGQNEYFAKASAVYGPYAPASYMVFNAWRLNKYFAQLEWSTVRELNNNYFEIERRYEKDTSFVTVGMIPTMAPNGTTNLRYDYRHADANQHPGWTYYRIKSVSKNGKSSYSEVKAVPPFLDVNIWPNPNRGQFQIKVEGNTGPVLVQVLNLNGQISHQYELSSSAVLSVMGLTQGTYWLTFYDKGTHRLMLSQKVMVLDR